LGCLPTEAAYTSDYWNRLRVCRSVSMDEAGPYIDLLEAYRWLGHGTRRQRRNRLGLRASGLDPIQSEFTTGYQTYSGNEACQSPDLDCACARVVGVIIFAIDYVQHYYMRYAYCSSGHSGFIYFAVTRSVFWEIPSALS
jgi:hypothetical protein